MPSPKKPARSAKAARPSLTKGAKYRHGNLREALVAMAIESMNERSDASFTLREAAQRIGVSHSAAYRHFPSKGALLAELAKRGFALLVHEMTNALEQGKTPPEMVRRLARAYLRTALEHPALFRCMFGPNDFGPEEALAVEKACVPAYELLAEAAKRISSGHEPTEERIENIGLALWSAVHGVTCLALDGQLSEPGEKLRLRDFETMSDRVCELLISGMLQPSSRI